MKRFHVHVHVQDLAASVAFYSKLFAAEPSRNESDYAKWMLDDPRINFAISSRNGTTGVDHLGFQTDDAGELAELETRARAADLAPRVQGEASCCYARSVKHWITDPQGIAWEHFHTLEDIAHFSGAGAPAEPTPATDRVTATRVASGCCGDGGARARPASVAPAASACC